MRYGRKVECWGEAKKKKGREGGKGSVGQWDSGRLQKYSAEV